MASQNQQHDWFGVRRFKIDSHLREYLAEKIPESLFHIIDSATSAQIYAFINWIIIREQLYEPNNPDIILCSPQMESVLKRSSFLLEDIPNIILCHTFPLFLTNSDPNPNDWPRRYFPDHLDSFLKTLHTNIPQYIRPKRLGIDILYAKRLDTSMEPSSTIYALDISFLKAIEFPKELPYRHFTYEEAVKLFMDFLELSPDVSEDRRNPGIYVFPSTPLEHYLGVKAISEAQIRPIAHSFLLYAVSDVDRELKKFYPFGETKLYIPLRRLLKANRHFRREEEQE